MDIPHFWIDTFWEDIVLILLLMYVWLRKRKEILAPGLDVDEKIFPLRSNSFVYSRRS